ncbi:hypothetical protein Bbelb_118380 [Branchiostoma belcheri]|nr:hypothetical protein Bbelb_118380 [Branchiostoma belcheri]
MKRKQAQDVLFTALHKQDGGPNQCVTTTTTSSTECRADWDVRLFVKILVDMPDAPACQRPHAWADTDGPLGGRFLSGTRQVPGQSPVLTRAACGRVPTGSYSSAGQLSGPWRGPEGFLARPWRDPVVFKTKKPAAKKTKKSPDKKPAAKKPTKKTPAKKTVKKASKPKKK